MRPATRWPGWRGWLLRFGLPFALLNALLTLENLRPTGWILPGLRLSFDDRSQVDLRDLSMNELDLLIAMLRVEKPLFYDEATERFSTDVRYPSD